MTDNIPTGDPTTVPIGELEELVERWEGERDKALKDELHGYAAGNAGCIKELQTLINEHDPKQ